MIFVLGISYSGESRRINTKFLPHLKRLNIPLIGMAKWKILHWQKYSDVFINIYVEKEACP